MAASCDVPIGMTENSWQRETPATAEPSEAAWSLEGRTSPNTDVIYVAVDASPFLVGRRSNLSLSIPGPFISGLHARLVVKGDELWLYDEGSTNGTYLNGERITSPQQLHADDIIQFGDVPFRLVHDASDALTRTVCHNVGDQAAALVQFDQMMIDRAVTPNYQPIVRLDDLSIIGQEVLGRSQVPNLETASAMFSAATQFNRQKQLSQMFRWKAIQETMSRQPPPHLFLNTHPAELEEAGLIESMRRLRKMSAAQSMTLEIHEASITAPDDLAELRDALSELNMRLAFDDFGAGQARIAELAGVHPDYLKFDISLIREIHLASPAHRQLVGTLVKMVQDLGIVAIAEGVETDPEMEACRELGFELAQGYLFGCPGPLGSE